MATVTAAVPVLTRELSLFHTTDPLLGNSPVLVFHGPSASIGATSSRIQVHVFTPAGLASYARLSVSPNSPFYSAVSNLPREEQGDEVCRGLAFGLKKYFSELPGAVRKTWCAQSKAPSFSALFGDDHIAILATRMTRIENVDEVIGDLSEAFCEQRLSWMDVDVVLPPGSVKERSNGDGAEDLNDEEMMEQRYGRYAELIASLGEVSFLPTSKIKRAPSKALAIGRSASFHKHNKENVREQLSELLNTEESYVSRLEDLWEHSEGLGADLKARYQSQLREVFSPAIGDIVKINASFLDELRGLIEESEETAVQDIELTSEDTEGLEARFSVETASDASGLVRVARCLCQWLPRFAACYTDYLSTHAHASQTLRTLLRSGDSLAAELQEIGEQKLTSLLIEPIQRLPRYNLYIDNLAKQLPIRHPALKMLLKARDVVSGLCTESVGTESSAMIDRLRSRTIGWQADINISGRLVTAVDFSELVPPYRLDKRSGIRGILLLFTDGIVVVEKAATSRATARTLLTEIESGSMPSKSVESLSDTGGDLHFVRRLHLDDVQCTGSHDGQALQVMTFFQLSMGTIAAQEPILDSCQVLQLENMYEGRAARFIEEMSKARVEGRFSEMERESSRWECRATDVASDSLGLLSAVIEDSINEHVNARVGASSVRVLVDIDRHSAPPRAGQNGVRTIVALSPTRGGDWRMTIDSVDGTVGPETLEVRDLVPAIRRKLAALIGVRFSIDQSASTACLLEKNSEVLQSIDLHDIPPQDGQEQLRLAPRDRVNRPKSPKKLLSSFLSSVGPGNESSHLRRDMSGLPMPPNFRMSTVVPKPPSRESRPSSRDQPANSSAEQLPASTHTKKLEDTLSAYILALQARKGNIVGKNLKMRVIADELQVSELYNSLLEDPNMMVLAAQAPLDVLFAAFEKFLNVVWTEQIGQVIPSAVLQDIQYKAETLFPADFDQHFRTTMGSLAPQNQRAFKAVMKLLADLLDGMGNDGDRGILTAAFAEVLVTEGNPHDYIALIDRFVDDTDTYFGEPVETLPIHQHHDTGSVNSHKRNRSVNSASLTSNTSSLRRKFGFGTLTRENSKSEQESKVASVWRTLSKSTRGDISPGPTPVGSFSRGSLSRAKSVDTDVPTLNARPLSSDGLKASSYCDPPPLASTPSSHNLTTIGEHPSFIPTGPPRKKRRSSLSDLKMLDFSPMRETLDLTTPQRLRLQHTVSDSPSLPPPTIPSTPSSISRGNSNRYGTPLQTSPRSRLPSSFRRELSPGPSRALGNAEQPRPKTDGDRPGDIVITARPTSNIPSLMPKPSLTQKHTPATPGRTGLSERPGAGNIVKKPSPRPEKTALQRRMTGPDLASSPAPTMRKLRMQSPQKLRERLQLEQHSVASTHSALQQELNKIGDELTSTASPSRPATARGSKTLTSRGSVSQPSSIELAQRVLKMEGQLPKQMEELSKRITSIQGDLTTSLSVSETKCKKLDELYREANEENEALYARFNDELGRILKAVRGGEGVEELKKKLKEAQSEASNLKRETSRLKRENVGLRAQMRE